MGLSKLATARKMIRPSILSDIPSAERRSQFYQHLYGEKLPDVVANRTVQA
jgi:hypothetical protein